MSNGKPRKTYEALRSYRWYGVQNLRAFGHRSRTKQMGFATEDYQGKPVIGIINTWSDMNSCHSHFPQRVEEIKRGVWQAGGFPVVLPAMSLGEPFVKPTTIQPAHAGDRRYSPRRRLPDGGLLLRRRHPGAAATHAGIPAFGLPDRQRRTLGENIEGAEVYNDEVIRPLDKPVWASGGLAVLRGNLAPRGAVIKPAAALWARIRLAQRPAHHPGR